MNQDYIMLIMNCKKYVKKAEFQKKTWLPLIPNYLKYYHVLGDENLDSEYKFDEESKTLYVKTMDDYNSLPKKVIASYNAVYKTFKFKYLFKTDDDQILCKPKFFDMLCGLINAKKPTPEYGGFVVDVSQPYLSQYYKIHPELPKHLPLYVTKYCSGRFYFLSYDAIEYLITKKEDIGKEYLEDYAVGFYLHPHYKSTIMHVATNQFFTDIEKSDFVNEDNN